MPIAWTADSSTDSNDCVVDIEIDENYCKRTPGQDSSDKPRLRISNHADASGSPDTVVCMFEGMMPRANLADRNGQVVLFEIDPDLAPECDLAFPVLVKVRPVPKPARIYIALLKRLKPMG